MLRNSFVRGVNKRLRELKRAINKIVIDQDVFRLKPNPFTSNELPFNFTSYGIRKPSEIEQILGIGHEPNFVADTTAIIEAQTPSDQLKAYQEWFKAQVEAGLLEVSEGYEDKPWTAPYVESAYKKAVVRTYNDVNGLAGEVGPFGAGSRAAFLQSAFGGAIGTRQIQLLATRSFQQLQGVTAAMEQNMSRILADGLAHGRGPREIARELNKTVTGLGRNRSQTIARTEIIHAYSEGQLDAYEQMNIEEVGVMAEWNTAGDDRVCEKCVALEGIVLEVKEARGLIPRHPNCRCAFIPSLVGEKPQAGQKTRKDQIEDAIEKSLQAQQPKGTTTEEARDKSTWAGRDRKIAKDRNRTPSIVKPVYTNVSENTLKNYPPAQPEARETFDRYRNKDGQWTPERQILHNKIVDEFLEAGTPVDQPVAYMTGGGPASGKSMIFRTGKVNLPKNVVTIDSDEIKKSIPDYKDLVKSKDGRAAAFGHEESSMLSKRVLSQASVDKKNLFLDGTGDSGIEKLKTKVNKMKQGGQKVVANYVTVDTETAVKRNVDRYKKTGRMVPNAYVRGVHENISKVLPQAIKDKIFDDLTLWDTNTYGEVKLVARQVNGDLEIIDDTLWNEFLKKDPDFDPDDSFWNDPLWLDAQLTN